MVNQDWFEMRDVRRRQIAGWVWVPLRVSHNLAKQGLYGHAGYSEEFFGLGSVAVPISRREQGNALGWSEIGLIHSQSSYAFPASYKPVDVYQRNDEQDLGIE